MNMMMSRYCTCTGMYIYIHINCICIACRCKCTWMYIDPVSKVNMHMRTFTSHRFVVKRQVMAVFNAPNKLPNHVWRLGKLSETSGCSINFRTQNNWLKPSLKWDVLVV